jgi:Tfp pilus assembly PilM family ATPase
MISRSQRILGLDIGSHTVKAVEVARSGDRFAITGYGQSEISAAGTLKDAISAVLREGRFKSKQVVSSVSGRSVIVRYINTPFMKQADLKTSMRFEADKYIPFDVNEVILDCVPLDDKPMAETGEMRVVLVAVKKQVVDEHVRLLQEAGLYPYVIDVDCFALGNSFELGSQLGGGLEAMAAAQSGGEAADTKADEENAGVAPAKEAAEGEAEEAAAKDEASKAEPDGKKEGAGEAEAKGDSKKAAPKAALKGRVVFALVDIGAQKTNINIMEGYNSYFTREVYIGGEDMTEAVSKHLGVTPAEADTIKRKGDREAEVLEGIAQTIDDLANEVFLSFDYFENQFDAEIKTVYLSGGGSRLKGIQGVLSQTLAREVKQWDPIAGFDVSLGQQQAGKLRDNAPQLAVALGLASRLRKV